MVSVAAIVLSSVFATTASAADKIPKPDPSVAQKASALDRPTDQFIVTFKPSVENNPAERGKAYEQAEQYASINIKEVKTATDGSQVVKTSHKLTADEMKKVQDSLENAANVESVEPDMIMHSLSVPNDPYYSNQWNLSNPGTGIRVPSVWDKTTGTGQVVAVIDSGIASHSDLNPNVVAGYDMVSNPVESRDGNGRDADPSDPGNYKVSGSCGTSSSANSTWHGTHIAGIIAAVGNNGVGVTGAAPGVKISPVRVTSECGGYLSDIMDGITWASGGTVAGVPANANPAKTINLSMGGVGPCPASLQENINSAVQRGSSIFVAAGNENQLASNTTPSNCNNVIVVGASNQSGGKASYSNHGSAIDIMAPGGDFDLGILSTLNTGTGAPALESYDYMIGTSMATPTAAAVGALMKAAEPSLTPAQIEARLKATARTMPGSCSGGCGAGLIDASAAVFPNSGTTNPSQTPIGTKAAEINGMLGKATSSEIYGLKGGGGYQMYERGAIVWSPATGAHVSMGAIRSVWSADKFENGKLGYPTTDEIGGLRDGGVYQMYERGAIVWSPTTGAHISIGDIRTKWASVGFENGQLGYPTMDEYPMLNGGVYQGFEHGLIVWSPETGAKITKGGIHSTWGSTGFEKGPLGYPTTDEIGGLKDGGVYQMYQGGAIVWSPATGAYVSMGGIRTAWASTGFENGRLGYPTSGEYSTGNGGFAQNYQGGIISWTPSGTSISYR